MVEAKDRKTEISTTEIFFLRHGFASSKPCEPWLLVDLSKLEVVDIFFSFTKPRDDEPQNSFSVRLPKREKNCINQDLQSKEFLEIC